MSDKTKVGKAILLGAALPCRPEAVREPKGADDDGAFPGSGAAISPEIMSGSVAYSIETQSVSCGESAGSPGPTMR